MDQSGCTQRGGRYSNVKNGRWVTSCLYPHIVRLDINRFLRVRCGSFRDQCPTDSSNPAEDLALRVNRHSAYPVGAERIPYLSNRLLDGSPRSWTCIAARAASVPGNLPGSGERRLATLPRVVSETHRPFYRVRQIT